jgi:uncharacterized protein (DUF1697 family)
MNYITLLRGINVSGKNIIKMTELTAMMETLKFKNIKTYIQSGNIVFSDSSSDTQKLEAKIKAAILKTFGHTVPVLVIEASVFSEVIKKNPYLKEAKSDNSFWHVTLLSHLPETEKVKLLQTGEYGSTTFKYVNKAIYLYTPDGYGNTKLSNTFIESKLKVSATTRNWKTMLTLQEMTEKI